MNEAAVLDGLKTLILENNDTLTQGLIHQSQQRTITHVTTSNLTVIDSYYFILLYAVDVSEYTKETVSRTTQASTSRVTRYQIQVEISDEAIVQPDDNEAYETMHRDFRKLCDRLVDLIERRAWVTTSPKTKLERNPANDRAIEKLNLSGTWQDTESNNWASLYSQLKFNLIDECVSTASLY